MQKTPPSKHLPPVFRWSFLGPKFWPTWLLLVALRVVAYLPMSVNFFLGRCLGWLFWHLAPSRARIADTNIRLCYPELNDAERNKLVRSIIQSCGISFLESAVGLWGPEKYLRRAHRINGLEHLRAAQQAGQGVLLVVCHMTTIDICARMMAIHQKIDILYRQDPNPLLAYMLVKARESFNGESIITVETRKLVRNLRAGHIVWYAPDQDYGIRHSIFAPFFGVPAATVPGTARFAALGNAQVIFFSHYREADGSYSLELSPPLDNFPTGDDIADSTRVNQKLEEMIRRQPDQYLWVHRRFKTRPEGEPNLYKKK
ncbi:LpxL/LpxP family Kdo(2)-lipid IV(A) lauroyl/palmitoleoyl acyltransferase [Cellvibrio sp. NN19]|uniref:LpxL/LpxP family Kdo(2)-lipid IV(A) lauroyl/palmitoleoyl acyltransferase n=1 Tax=Cellvibrio chitinivorans TaxID=3102792 RepID=UPI002B413197|nr:LpxL/LpxP family Kdo(2)-lipid IV(A) lauroyl/palmitoleoyl acyltransferase [Cellvibrio sp. NN19]